jgi:ectoine hydroxylase-related dioxygenase (phytanoyl-CoA dioxygenase family)
LDLTDLRCDGYQIVRGVVPSDEVAALLDEIERLKSAASELVALDPRIRAVWSKAQAGGSFLRILQNAHLASPELDRFRLHAGLGQILQAMLGGDIKTVVTSIFFKPPSEIETGIGYHQDAVFRQPLASFRNLAHACVHLAIALDPQDESNGCMRFIPGSHRGGHLYPRPSRSVLEGDAGIAEIQAVGMDPASAKATPLASGDIVLWNPFVLHGSSPNRSAGRDRRSLTIVSMRTADCDAGVVAYDGGRPVPAIADIGAG